MVALPRRTEWHGTALESRELLTAVGRYCICVVDRQGVRSTSCPAHAMLIDDQRTLDGLLFARRYLRARLYLEEWA